MRFPAGSVVSAVYEGSHAGGRPKRARRASGESFWTSMNSAMVIETVAASRTGKSLLQLTGFRVSGLG